MSSRSCVVRLRAEGCGWLVAVVLGTGLAAATPTHAMQPDPPDLTQVEEAQQALREDSDLGLERTVNRLRWNQDDEEEEQQAPGWLTGMFAWIGQAMRMLIWVLAALLAATIIIYLLRLLRDRRAALAPAPRMAPARVRDLDIRPESLPDDVGAAARQLWDAGEFRRALALLYRGMLSRLAYVHAAPVRDSTTEGESMALARGCLGADKGEFAVSLVRIWQLAVYGGRMPESAEVHAICAGFGPALDPPPPAGEAA